MPELQSAASGTGRRHLFIDLFRSVVIFFMLEGHVYREFLSTSIQQTSWFIAHELFHGISAPAFLFGAGLTFVITTRQRWEDYHHWGPPLARRVRRLLFIILLGFIVHLPFFSMRKIILEGTTNNYLQLFQCDVLVCIGIGLLSLHAIVFFFKSERRFYGLVLVTILTVVLLTPLVWDVDFLKYLPPFPAQLMNSMHGSYFPLFPFVGFLYAGVIVSWEFTLAIERKQERKFMRQVAWAGLGLMIGGTLLNLIPIQIYPTYNFWYTSPNYFFIRLGALMLLLAGFWFLSQRLESVKRIWTVFGKESLFVYALHLFVLYGTAMNVEANLRASLGGNLTLSMATLVLVLLTAAMLIAALFWNWLKERHHHLYRIWQLTAAAWLIFFLFTRDY